MKKVWLTRELLYRMWSKYGMEINSPMTLIIYCFGKWNNLNKLLTPDNLGYEYLVSTQK